MPASSPEDAPIQASAAAGSAQRDPDAGDWYARPAWYDILHTPGTAEETNILENIEHLLAPPPLRANRVWLEPACGTARILRCAAARGRRVIGIDNTPEMVAYARRSLAARGISNARARILHADMTGFDTPWPADTALCTINSIRHLDTDRAMIAHLNTIARALKPGGIYIVGIGIDSPAFTEPQEDIWRARRGSLSITQTIQYLPPDRSAPSPQSRTERVISHLTMVMPTRTRHFTSTYTLRTWSLDQWRRIIGRSDLAVLAVADAQGNASGSTIDQQIADAIDPHWGTYAHWVLQRRADPPRNPLAR
ncbi:MAG: class I SAM-dependent methyltransferase [Phycisphaerales bacterium]